MVSSILQKQTKATCHRECCFFFARLSNTLVPAGQSKYTYIMNYSFLKTERNLKALYIFHCLFTTSSVKLYVVTEQIFLYKFLFTNVFSEKRKNSTHKTFQKFENKCTFGKWSTFRKWTHIKKFQKKLAHAIFTYPHCLIMTSVMQIFASQKTLDPRTGCKSFT